MIKLARVLNDRQRLSLPRKTRFYIDPQADKVRAVKAPGDINRNNQQLLRQTGERGTDHNARVWVLKCRHCSNIYGSNSTDAWERKCPKCQKGKPGLGITAERHGEDWTREEHILAFNLYSQIPFGKIHTRNPKVQELAERLGRSFSSASRKLANFSRLDPFHQKRGVVGLPHGAKGEEEIWHEFAKNPESLAFESEKLLAELEGKSVEEVAQIETDDLPPPGKEREAIVRVRVNQSFFRRRVLSAYDFRCCVTGLSVQRLLVASHIIPWAEDTHNRLNPRNGLCLNALHDRAFDCGLMWIEKDFTVKMSLKLKAKDKGSSATTDWLLSFNGKRLILPDNFKPDAKLLKKHATKCLNAMKRFG
jgi:putative restriction endonuclease